MPRLLDLFCGAGGTAMGYHRAGFEVVGVDIKPQPRFPFEFHQADALTYPLVGFDVIHASPPCQGYSHGQGFGHKRDVPRLIPRVRDRVSGLIYVIENVKGAEKHLRSPVMLCGAMFGIGVIRHRFFESSVHLPQPPHNCHGPEVDRDLVSVTGHAPPPRWYKRNPGKSFNLQIWKTAMGIDWMTRDELREAIPPVYTEWIGRHLLHPETHGEGSGVLSEECNAKSSAGKSTKTDQRLAVSTSNSNSKRAAW